MCSGTPLHPHTLRASHEPLPCSLRGCSAALIARLGVGWWQRVTLGEGLWIVRWWKVQQQGSGRLEKKEITVCPGVTVVRCVTG
jgi:hypothetical protein